MGEMVIKSHLNKDNIMVSVMNIQDVINFINNDSGMDSHDRVIFYSKVHHSHQDCWEHHSGEIAIHLIRPHMSPEVWRQLSSNVVMTLK